MITNFFTITDNTKPTFTTSFGTKLLELKGSLVYEYNPLRVYRVNEDTMIEDDKGDYIQTNSTGELVVNNINYNKYTLETSLRYSYYPKNSIIDLDTTNLKFDLNHPIDILTLESYDGSINLILNDGEHSPKLINSRFSATGLNTYLIVDREGDNDTNIYDNNSFDTDVSLYKKVNDIVKLKFIGLATNGYLKVGNYTFYFKLADSDGNETDFVAESGRVSCYIGNLNDPFSQRGGLEDENSFKSVNFILSNIDSSYNLVVVYYTRSTGTLDGTETTTAYKVNKQYNVYNNVAKITITGFEGTVTSNINEINAQYEVVDSSQTLITCLNMLFLGNVKKPNLEYKELADLSLRFLPLLNDSNNIGRVDEYYKDSSGGYEYYNAENIYNKLGYWDDEIYRFGVVYILNDYTLSPAFNIRGIKTLSTNTSYDYYPVYNENNDRNYITIDKETYRLDNINENSKGVVLIKYGKNLLTNTKTIPIGLNFKIATEAIAELKKYTKGFFFVRLKRNKTTFCLAVSIGLDITSHIPVLPIGYSNNTSSYMTERFLDDDKMLVHDFDRRIYTDYKEGQVLSGYAAICPEYELNLGYFNLFFTASDFVVTKASFDLKNKYFSRSGAYLYNLNYEENTDKLEYDCTITAVADDIKAIRGKSLIYSSRAGEAAEATKIGYCGYKNKSDSATNLIRGSYSPYIGVEGYNTLPLSLINIKIPNYDSSAIDSYFEIRYRDSSKFHAISDRYSWDDIKDIETNKEDEKNINYGVISNIFRGDCFICNYTHRMNRNFQDSDAPTNDEIIDSDTWLDHYEMGKTDSESERAKINRGDVNAVKMGHWVTVKVCSNINLSLRCTDPFYTTETGLTGRVRAFYPLRAMDTAGEAKIPESALANGGLNKSLSDKYYVELQNVPAIKNKFNTRIMYSDISINEAYKNGYRVFRLGSCRDYPLTYGNITRMIEWGGNIICIFEHGVAVIPVNERAVAGRGAGGNVFINTSNVLPENPNILSSTFGSQWSESIIRTPYAIYGVDTVAKKIWRISIEGTDSHFALAVLSDFKVLRFLNENISLSDSETTPTIGIRNVKSHYNAFKNDIMFTFYDDVDTIEEKVWNLCYNEILLKFITFYSWVPSYSENIDNIFFSFDRNTSKNIAKLYANNSLIHLLSNLTSINNITTETTTIDDKVYNKIGELTIDNISSNATLTYSIPDNTLNSNFSIANNILYVKSDYLDKCKNSSIIWQIPINVKISIAAANSNNRLLGAVELNLEGTITLASDSFISTSNNTYFWKHGLAGLTKTKTDIKPCNWYGKQHPFEFECIMVNDPGLHKIFTDLELISNKAAPESLHFEISGEVYSFADDKKNMFFRLEALKNFYQYNGGDILYNSDYLNIIPELKDIPYSTSIYKARSTEFPIYYSRVNTINEIEDYYQSLSGVDKDYQRISGSEIIYDKLLNQFNIATHIKACPFGKVYKQEISTDRYNKLYDKGYNNIGAIANLVTIKSDNVIASSIAKSFSNFDIRYSKTNPDNSITAYEDIHCYELMQYGRLTGNMQYQEDIWLMLIPSIVYWQKNEKAWKYPPLTVNNSPLPEGLVLSKVEDSNIPKNLNTLGYTATNDYFDTTSWSNTRKETRLRDKYLRIKIRYSGEDLAIIYALKTLYTVSYG